MSTRWVAVAGVCALLVASVGGAGVAAQSPAFDLAVADSLELPERTVTLEGERFTVSAVAQRDPGDSLAVEARAPAGTSYSVNLIDADRRVLAAASATGNASVTVSLAGVDPGTYLLALVEAGEPRAIHPVVVRGYALAIDAPATARINTSIDVTVSVERTASPASLSRVELVFTGENETFRGTVPEVSDGTYRVSLPLRDTLAPGNYTLFAVAEGEGTIAFGRPPALGVSDGHALAVRPANGSASFGTATATPTRTSPGPTPTRDAITPYPTTVPETDGGAGDGPGSVWPWLVGAGLVVWAGYWYVRRR